MQMLQLRMSGVAKEQLQQLNMDYPLSEHSRALCRVGPGSEEPFDDDDATDEEQARVDSDLESDGDDGDDSEMGQALFLGSVPLVMSCPWVFPLAHMLMIFWKWLPKVYLELLGREKSCPAIKLRWKGLPLIKGQLLPNMEDTSKVISPLVQRLHRVFDYSSSGS
ncbi:hypothetical protein HAX54_047337 [Datura stramonium]|uniref:Uncharacterized protein n=1 Tax=Datura stramonium TaxID=4076 RepID=A0ABS8SSY9_DATST|nr:hypothetical protein [Datura stramonium]